MYPEEMCSPMRQELVDVGFVELKSSTEVDRLFSQKNETILLIVNSVCGCAAGNARPAVKMSTQFTIRPSIFATVFAGQDIDATDRAREYMLPFPPSSPSIALMKEGKVVHMIERHHIEGKSADIIAQNLKEAFKEFC